MNVWKCKLIFSTTAVSGNGTRSRDSLEEGGHRGGIRVLQPLIRRFEEGWRSVSDSRSKKTEPLSHETQVQDAYYQASRVPNEV